MSRCQLQTGGYWMAHAVRSPPDCAVHLPGLRDMHSDECSLHAYIGNGPPAQAIPRKDGKLETDFPHVTQQSVVMDVDAVQDSKPLDVTEVPDVEIADEIRHVKLPVGWEGLSLKLHAGKLLVSEVPKACFSSKSFESGAKPQVEGVFEGDEIISMNGEPPSRVEERILSKGDSWNACSAATPPHSVGSKGKFDSPPCVACDFQRRRQALGLDVALQMWLRAVKREIRFTLAVKSTGIELPRNASNSATSLSPAAGNGDKASSVVELKGSSTGGTLRKMKSLDELTKERQPVQKDFLKKGKGKGKVKGKGKGKTKKPSGPHLPRTRVSKEPLRGEVLEWKSKFGWIKASSDIDHPMAEKRQGKIYINVIDLITRKSLAPGEVCEFHLYSDASGLGAEECWVVGDEDWSEWTAEGEAMEGSDDWEWTDDDWNRWQSSDGSSEVQAQDV
ncbi:unnamed protein product [Symbiodinium necroappetens]|uniref:Uncharacterized protein n=1 Tax=Symbiodinium necroappetens TaxID=1628268 RepID=A0A812N9Y4_9DINO|nr:unnamed protein product [Symbiodinium necroappetens]